MSTKRLIRRKLEKLIESGKCPELTELGSDLFKVIDKPDNLILLTDAYKYSHPSFYGGSLTHLESYAEARGGMFGYTLWKGLQGKLKQYLAGVAITKADVDEAEYMLNTKDGVFMGNKVFFRERFDYIVDVHGGRLPIEIKSVPEGTPVSHHNVLMTIKSTDPKCAWVVNFLESLLLQVWYPTTVATLSREVKKVVLKAFKDTTTLTGADLEFAVSLVLNDFGFRGVSSVESAKTGGAGHLVNFIGSDNVIASQYIQEYYNTDLIRGKGIPATEHSVMTLRGKEGEVKMMESVLDAFPVGPVACVSDTYDIMNAAINLWGDKLRDKVLSRPAAPGNQLIIRPDSGDVNVTLIKLFEALFDKFGYTTNGKGYRVLPPQVRVIQGDGVNFKSILGIYDLLKEHKISAENLALGMGGKLLQADINRDTHKFAFKASYAILDGEEVNVVKSPIVFDANGDRHESFKKSKQGKLKLRALPDGKFETITSMDPDFDMVKDHLQLVFRNGEMFNESTFEEIIERAEIDERELVSR
jgi:nicotinamide phosphoribosyltransferase